MYLLVKYLKSANFTIEMLAGTENDICTWLCL